MTGQQKDGTLTVDRPAQQTLPATQERQLTVQDGLIDVIARAAKDPTIDVEKMERLLALKQKIDEDHRKQLFMAALSRVQQRLPQINKEGRIVVNNEIRSRFARLEDIDKVIRPILGEEGFALSFNAMTADQKIRMIGRLSHEAGHFEEKEVTLPADTGPGRNAVQAVGSTVTYARRMLIKMFFNLVETFEDDDGRGGSEPISEADRNKILDLLISTNTGEARYLKYMGVAKVDDILQRDLPKALNALTPKAQRPA